jgi:type II secretory pathway component GspD/PulD (secretin)
MKLALALLSSMLLTDTAAAADEPDNGVPIEKIIVAVAHRANRKFVVDPRVDARVHLIGEDPAQVTYSELLTILQVHGYVTAESSGYVLVIPDASARQIAQPQLTKGQTYPDAQIVNHTFQIENVPAAFLVPILRPMLPQYAQLAAIPCSNTLVMVDRYANVKRIEAVIKTVDIGTPYKPEKCEPSKRSDS